jgi:hypothetical protein
METKTIIGCARGDSTVGIFTDGNGRAFRGFVARLEALFGQNSLVFISFSLHQGEAIERVTIRRRDGFGTGIVVEVSADDN